MRFKDGTWEFWNEEAQVWESLEEEDLEAAIEVMKDRIELKRIPGGTLLEHLRDQLKEARIVFRLEKAKQHDGFLVSFPNTLRRHPENIESLTTLVFNGEGILIRCEIEEDK